MVGGGVSRKADKFLPLLKLNAEIVPAKLQNTAGIVGAAWLAADRQINPAPTSLSGLNGLHPVQGLDAEQVETGRQHPLGGHAQREPGVAYLTLDFSTGHCS